MNILVSSYTCDPYGVSEAYLGFKWVDILSQRYNVTLITPKWWVENIKKFYAQYNSSVPFKIIEIELKNNNSLLSKNKFFLYVVKYPYFSFNYKSYKTVKRIGEQFDCILHKTPIGVRYHNILYKLNSKLVLGPLSGGLKSPKELKCIRRREGAIALARQLDKLWFFINPWLRKTYERAENILISSDYIRHNIPSKYSNKFVKIFETGIDTTKYNVSLNKSGDIINLLFVGRLVPYKGLEIVIRALKKLDLQEYNIRLDVLGDGPEKAYYIDMCNKLGLHSVVNFHGRVDISYVRKYFDNCDIFCFPTVKEASGNVFLEAMASGKAILCANIGGPREMLDADSAVLVDIADEEKFINDYAANLKKLINDEELRIRLGRNARKRVENNFDWHVIQRQIYDYFDKFEQVM